MTVDDIIQQAQSLKESGNAQFKNKDVLGAHESWKAAVDLLETTDCDDRSICHLKMNLSLNLSQASICLKRWLDAVDFATNALAINAQSSKAFYRRGIGQLRLHRFEDSIKDFQEVAKIEPKNPDIKKMLMESSRSFDIWSNSCTIPHPSGMQPTSFPDSMRDELLVPDRVACFFQSQYLQISPAPATVGKHIKQRFLTTIGIYDCIAVFVFDELTGKAFGAHISPEATAQQMTTLVALVDSAFGSDSENDLKVWLVGGYRNRVFSEAVEETLRQVSCLASLQIKFDKRLLDTFELGGVGNDEMVVRSRNQYFVAAALDLELGVVVTHTKAELIGSMFHAEVCRKFRMWSCSDTLATGGLYNGSDYCNDMPAEGEEQCPVS